MSVEPRYNLATKVMSNGVEVIVAGDRWTRPGEPEYLRLLSSTVTRPITLAPHTLSHHMSMMLRAELQSENDALSSLQPAEALATLTLTTTYIFPTAVVNGEETSTETTSTVVTNVKQVNSVASPPAQNQEITLSASPVLQSQVHRTVYTYLNTVMDGEQPLVATSKHTVQNTLLAPAELQPSEEAVPETNTYYATKEFVRTVTDGTDSQVVSTQDTITQVVITDPPSVEILNGGTVDVTKTYFVTYTYFSTYLENDETKVSSHISVSTDIAVEKFTLKDSKTSSITPTASASIKTTALPSLDKPHSEKLTANLLDDSENTIEPSESDLEDSESSTSDIIDEWYEKFKVKSTTELDLTKTRLKTKTTLKHKSKTKSVVKSESSTEAQTSSYSTSVIKTSTVTPQGATLLPGDQVIVLQLSNGQTSMIPVSDPAKKKPKNGTEVQVSDMLSLGALGINSMNVLGPVFNAMADMLKSHQKEALKRRNDTVPMQVKKTASSNPLLDFVSNLAHGGSDSRSQSTTTPRGPLYIPVGVLSDAETSESEGHISVLPTPEKWTAEKAPPKWATHHLDKNRRTHDNSPTPIHLEGGIPISPGQVINTNSDVIIGRPSASGPRPPVFAIKDNLPIDMKPPPVEEHLEPIGQFSTNQGVDPDARPIEELIMKPPPPPRSSRPPQPPPQKPLRPQHPPPKQAPSGGPSRPKHPSPPPPPPPPRQHDSGAYDLNPPPPPPPAIQHRPPEIVPIPVHIHPDDIIQNYVNPVHLPHDNFALPNEVLPTASIPLQVSHVVSRPHGQPLLVNIQPSQVAQVVIPHGSSSAVIISEEKPHSTKGEVIDDPKPHPEPETVGFISAEPVLKVENNEVLHHPINSMVEIMKAETVTGEIHHGHHPTHTIEHSHVRPRPDFDNIGMRPPAVPVSPVQVHPQIPVHPPFTLSKNDPNGMYVDISPPGHLPPHLNAERPTSVVPQPPAPIENTANHQSGIVHDVPLSAQVQLGSGHPSQSPLHEILINFDGEHQTVGAQTKQDVVPRPNDFADDLAPPPPPPSQQRPPNRPSNQNHSPGHVHRYPLPHGNPNHQNHHEMPEPADFMKPPPRPDDSILVPVGVITKPGPSVRPGEIMVSQPTDYIGGEDDMDVDDDPYRTEDGEEIQESNARPLLPGQIPLEVEKLRKNQSMHQPSTIGVGQTLSFGNTHDKSDDLAPAVREPETIVGSQMPGSGSGGFNKNNEAVVSVGSKPMSEESSEMVKLGAEMDNVFGVKLPAHSSSNNVSRNDDMSGILRPPQNVEVMGMSPPPVERPRRPNRPQRPNTPFKFEMPTAPNLPMDLDNDFPPVRTPDINKKPFKPEDIFPPRLPDNFVYREYEINTRKPPNKRPFVTSLPIDTPTTSTTERSDVQDPGAQFPSINDVNYTPNSPPATSAPSRPKPIIHERPPNVNMQKPSIRPPTRPPSYDQKLTPRPLQPRPDVEHSRPPVKETPPKSQNEQKRGPPPFPFERPPSDGNFGDKMRPNQPTRGPTGFEKQPPKRPPYEQPPRNEVPLEPPPRLPPTRPPIYRPPIRQPPTGFDHASNRPPILPPTRPPPPSRPPPDEPPMAPPPSAFERPPPSPVPSEFEQPPPPQEHRPVVFEQPGRDRPTQKPVKFDNQPERVEPSPHFEGQPAQGHTKPERPVTQDVPNKDQKPSLPPPALHHQHHQGGNTPRPVELKPTGSVQSVPVFDQDTALNEPVKYKETPPLKGNEGKQNSDRPSQQPPSKGTTQKPTPSVRPPQIPIPSRQPIPSREPIRPSKPVESVSSTPNIVTMVTSGSTTIFGDLYTDPLVIQPSRVISSSQGIHFTMDDFPHHRPQSVMVVASQPVTHTTTLTVTSTMTTVLHSAGMRPITNTVVLTTTLISTIVDKVTETETLVKPTTSTVTQTHTISTTKTALVVPTAVYPPRPGKYPSVKPEIFMVDAHDKPVIDIVTAGPHDKIAKPEIFVADPRDKDTITLTVGSSMNKDHKKQKVPINNDQHDNESILLLVTDKPPAGGKKEETAVLLGAGVLSPAAPYPHPGSSTECLPECKATRNELCVKQEGIMKCVCRPGFARMFLDQPCKPTYTYSMQLLLDRMGPDPVHFQQGLQIPGSPKFVRMAEAAKEGLNRMVMQSDLRDIYHGVAISGFQPKDKKTMVDFYVQLSENVEEGKVLGMFKKTLRNSNFSLGGTEMFAAREMDFVHIEDFNECLNTKFNDCSEHARCFNLKGTYTCSCKEGFTDISENPLYPGRLCSDMIGCEYCGYHGTCYQRGEQTTCECFQWYTGDRCRINMKVLLIALVTIGAILLALLLVCIVMTCIKRRSSRASKSNGSTGYLRYRGPTQSLDKRAMIVDTSSESSVENLPYVAAPLPPPLPQPVLVAAPRKPALRHPKRPAPRPQPHSAEQRDRSLTVMIPRVKYRTMPPVAPVSPHLTMSTFSPDKHLNRTAAQIATEQKLINYLDGSNAPQRDVAGGSGGQQSQRPSKEEKRIYEPKPSTSGKKDSRVFEYEYKTSNMHIADGTSSGERRSKDDRFRRYSDQTPLHHDNSLHHRKYSAGALVSAGYAVSATGGVMHDIEESTIASNTLKSNRSQFTTLNRCGDHKTMSEARSYDETLIQPQTRPLRTNYSGSTSSRLLPDENHTMVERDLGSTFLLPESHLFKPAGDRGSDISNFDSL